MWTNRFQNVVGLDDLFSGVLPFLRMEIDIWFARTGQKFESFLQVGIAHFWTVPLTSRDHMAKEFFPTPGFVIFLNAEASCPIIKEGIFPQSVA
jgi:hypothetical protein